MKETPAYIDVSRYNQELEAAEKRIDSGEYILQEDIEKEAAQWCI